MAKLTNILNGILGAGANRQGLRNTTLKSTQAPIWEVRAKFDKPTRQTKRPVVKA
ncbi:MAG: hypothetical protein ACI9MR_001005 [Myxococcota bacterium]|jgi:hypothetical protein